MEKRMGTTLEKQAEIESLLAQPEIYEDGKKASDLLKEFHDIQVRAEKELEELSKLEANLTELKNKAKALEAN